MKTVYLLILCLALGACSYAPQPAPRFASSQQTMESAAHWQTLAADFIKKANIVSGQSVYVPEKNDTPFNTAFSRMLQAEVLKNQGELYLTPQNSTVRIEWDSQTIKYATPRHSIKVFPGSHSAATGIGVASYYIADATAHHPAVAPFLASALILDGALATQELEVKFPLDAEVLITFRAISNEQIITQGVAIFYMRKDDAKLYSDEPPFAPTTQYKIISE